MMSWPLERLDDAAIGYYENGFKTGELRELLNAAIQMAEVELYPVVFDTNQRKFMAAFMNAQVPPLDPCEAQNWIVAYKILELEGRSILAELPTHKVDLTVPEPPPLPVKIDGPKSVSGQNT